MGVMDVGHLASGPDAGRWIHEAARELLPAEGGRAERAGMANTMTPWRVTLPVGRVPEGDTIWLRLGFLETAAERLETQTFPLPGIGETVAVSPDLSLVRKGDEMRAGTLEMVFEVRRDPATVDGQTVRVAAEPVRVRVLSGGDDAEPISRLSGWRCEAERATCVALTVPQSADLSSRPARSPLGLGVDRPAPRPRRTPPDRGPVDRPDGVAVRVAVDWRATRRCGSGSQ